MQIYWNKRKRLHNKRVQLPEDWFGTPTWPRFHCFGTPILPPWRHETTLYMAAMTSCESTIIEFVYIFSLPWWNSATVQQKGKLYRRAWGTRFLCVWHRLQWNSLRKLHRKLRFMPRYIKEIFIISVAEVMNVRHVSLIRVGWSLVFGVTIQMKASEQYFYCGTVYKTVKCGSNFWGGWNPGVSI